MINVSVRPPLEVISREEWRPPTHSELRMLNSVAHLRYLPAIGHFSISGAVS